MKKVFIVTNEGNTRVISENVLVKDLSEVLKRENLKVKRKDVELFVKGAIDEHNGRAMDNTMYTNLLKDYSKSLAEYSHLTPYLYYRKFSPMIVCVTDRNYPSGCAGLGYAPENYTEEQIRQ